ncbi:MAG: DUF1957 domain-containing protein [Chloroflexi bacterium]|nr:DUF1957 domain-containing protein [Chloroflexota bacterium]
MGDAYALVLHSHLPYCRGAGLWPHGEEWIHEAILGTYLPLLVTLHDLRADRVPFQLTIGITPILLEQLADPDIVARSLAYIDDQIARAEFDEGDLASAGARERAGLAAFYGARYRMLRDAYVGRFRRDLVGAFADLQRSGHVELLTSAATHGYLPLLDEPSVHAQLENGLRSSERLLGFRPRGIWLPECAYAPGLERALEAHGLTHFFTDGNLISGAEVSTATRLPAWEERPSGGGTARRIPVVLESGLEADVFTPYLVADSGVAAVARHGDVSGQVWSAASGYPGDPAYREFHRKDDRTGLRYWSVTATTVGLGNKDDYDVDRARERVRTHAAHFAGVVRESLADHRRRTGTSGLLTTTFDSELFGHWWFEGIEWLGLVLRELASGTTTVERHLTADPPRERVTLREGSWGKNNDHSTWLSDHTRWMWDELARLAAEVEPIRKLPPSDPLRARAARQAVRELLLTQSSDWPFLVDTGQAGDYAVERFVGHAKRMRSALEIARHGGNADEQELIAMEGADNPFPDASLDTFAPPANVLGVLS